MPFLLEAAVSGLGPFTEKLQELGGTNPEARDELYLNILNQLALALVQNLRAETPKFRGALARSTDYRIIITEVEEGETEYRIEVVQIAQASGFTYRPITVTGRLPGNMPPILALQGWVQLRWGLDATESLRGAFRLANSIALRGSTPSDYKDRAIENSAGVVQEAANNLGIGLVIEVMDSLEE